MTKEEKAAAAKAKADAKKAKEAEKKAAAKKKADDKKAADKAKADAAKKKLADDKAAKKLKAEADKKAALEAKNADKKAAEAKKEKAVEGLAVVAKEINHRVEQAAQLDGKADDHRLAAALKLAEAEATCKDNGVKFKEWCAENVKWSVETIRKMLPIAKAPDPVKALADMRAGNAQANQAARDRKTAAAASPGSAVAPSEAAKALEGLKPTEAKALIAAKAEALGQTVVETGNVDALQELFDSLKPTDKMKFARYVAAAIGATLTLPGFETEAA